MEQCTEASTEAVTTNVDVYEEPKRDPDQKPSEKHHKNLMLAENLKQVPVLSTNKDAQGVTETAFTCVLLLHLRSFQLNIPVRLSNCLK